jgi:UDP-glucose 4-epimerase
MAAFNLGSETGASVREVVDMAVRVTGRAITTRLHPRRAGDAAKLIADAAAARRILGWCPSYDALERQIETAWEWQSRYREVDLQCRPTACRAPRLAG